MYVSLYSETSIWVYDYYCCRVSVEYISTECIPCFILLKGNINLRQMYSYINNLSNALQFRTTWEAASCAIALEFLATLWNPRFHSAVHRSALFFSTLSQTSTICATQFYTPKIRLHIINLPQFLFLVISFLLDVTQVTIGSLLSSPAKCHAHLLHPDGIIERGEEYSLWDSSLCILLHSELLSLRKWV
jgi:hypothetical protein